ncbi:16S rRNA (uracil(1498)-N(3))-methyltransferase [Alkalibacter rhizosphaerae]|uniref:Ribosomal RNA small subunit methyltransferase E n=1 Tax=Alkalibacter rhizosphaerae TaxID=2815577 RepID=A0A974XHD6_9FIRM|nr:16S rRNA (uracil(1498)-N(3))-methyltransferase [Alkalibacter rhizosphaerae]QSX08388.1 16S rRNA (uracil(1498)-N(3))-methyltransferase [Alkalibacter rhizosphaerae]
MHRFFEEIEGIKNPGEELVLTEDNHDHLSKSLRMRMGDTIVICDGNRTDYVARIQEMTKKETKVVVESRLLNASEAPVSITLFQGIPKGQKMDVIVQKAVELGVTTIVPLYTHRSIPKERDMQKKIIRWNKIALEAAKQSGRGMIPQVEESVELLDLSQKLSDHHVNLVAYEEQQNQQLKHILTKRPMPVSAGIIIGPEGGFDPSEIRWLEQRHVQVVGLGPRILRTETAAMAMLSMMLYEWELAVGGNE